MRLVYVALDLKVYCVVSLYDCCLGHWRKATGPLEETVMGADLGAFSYYILLKEHFQSTSKALEALAKWAKKFKSC